MGILRHPSLFSQHFNIDAADLARLGVFDPILNSDTKLFIDPLLLRQSSHETINQCAVANFEDYFGKIIKVLKLSKVFGDVPWRNAERLFTFKEPSETCLGYGDRTIRGSAIGPTLRVNLMRTAKEIIDLGVNDPELFALLGLLEENIGADRISDMTTHAIRPALIKFNIEVLSSLGVTTEAFWFGDQQAMLVGNPFETSKRTPVLLVPKDILRELPVAHDWHDVADAAGKNEELRRRVNERIGDIWAIRTRKDKDEARRAVLSSKQAFESLMESVGMCTKVPYDPNADPQGHYVWRQWLTHIAEQYPLQIIPPQSKTPDELERVVDTIIEAFVDLVENKGQWYHFWQNGDPRHERASQRLFFAVSEVYCKANNLDVSPETDSGGGSVDFKFSSGYDARVLVEIKLSKGRVVHGYQTQLEVYKRAVSTTRAKYLVIDVGGMGEKLDQILDIKNMWAKKGDRVSDIIVVDGTKKLSASVRPN